MRPTLLRAGADVWFPCGVRFSTTSRNTEWVVSYGQLKRAIFAKARCEKSERDWIRQKRKYGWCRHGYEGIEWTTEASRPGAPRGHTRENQTTSTNIPRDVPRNFLNKLGEMHTAERELTLALPLVAKAAKSKDLKTLLQVHLKETKGHMKALEAVAKSLG
jgi:hypothetical protein